MPDPLVFEPRFVPDQLLVQFEPGTPQLTVHEVNTERGAFIIGTFIGDPNLYAVQIRPGLDIEEAIDQYEMNPNVVRASKNLIVSIPEERGDGFGDLPEGARFFSEGPSRFRWAVGQNGNARCDLRVRRPGTAGRAVEALFFGAAGGVGSNWTLASYKGFGESSLQGLSPALSIQIATTDGSTFSGKTGRIGVGFIGRTGLANRTCLLTGLAYEEHSFTASTIGGLQLDDARPFWHTTPPYTERLYPVIPIADLTQINISITLTTEELTLRIFSVETGSPIFTVTEPLPAWNESGSRTPIFAYWGGEDGTYGALDVRSFSVR
jgi:hypothetical protein